jgi:hypothetical protein
VCLRHPGETAAYICDGCGEFLCIDCTREGKALTFCALCGERALPVDEVGRVVETRAPVVAPKRAARAYSIADGLLFPFRGLQGIFFGVFAVLVGAVEGVGFYQPEGSPLLDPARVGFALALASVLADAVRSTAEGENDLESIPDYREIGMRFREVASLVIVGGLTLATVAFFLSVLGCFDSLLSGQGVSFGCILGLVVGLEVSAFLWLLGFGAGALMDSVMTTIRLDQHWVALRLHGGDALRLTVPPMVFLVVGVALPWLVPGYLVTYLLRAVLVLYAAFLTAHLAGLFFRWHLEPLRKLYQG